MTLEECDKKLGMAVIALQPFAAIDLPPQTDDLPDSHKEKLPIRIGDLRRAREIHDLIFDEPLKRD